MDKKILVLVLCTNLEKYVRMADAIKNTWGSDEHIPDNITVRYYFGEKISNQTECIEDDDRLYTPNIEVYESLTSKMVDAFNFYKDYDFDYLFRPCDGSYIDLDNLNKWIESFPEHTNIFRGVAGDDFVSGSGFLLSRDIFDLTIKNINLFGNMTVDDVALGKVLNVRLGVPITTYNVTRYDMTPVMDNETLGGISDAHLSTYYHYHMRNFPDLMYAVHDKVIEYKRK